jgi:uncharacterized repeat protein (TIGR03847 family)
MTTLTLDDPHHVTVGTIGEAGRRTFLVQAEDDDHRVTMIAEKQQVEGIGDLLARLLVRLDETPPDDWDRAAMAVREPVEPLWRIGRIEVGLDADARRFRLEFEAMEGDDEHLVDEVVFTVDTDLARRLAAQADWLVDQGRPRCRLCGRPMAEDGSHVCPATNGHGRLTV